ncbi:MAG: PRC-barrel domain-containing protein [Candidatus Nanoarchaeia archaeon]|nr:PRC-barrel domain-containing protein [Candidatus Jingweiarchaeum tengchongense]
MVEKSDSVFSKNILGKTVVSKAGKKFGEVGDIIFETRTGELIYVVLKNSTSYASQFELEKDANGNFQVPFNAVIAVGDFVVVAEEDII